MTPLSQRASWDAELAASGAALEKVHAGGKLRRSLEPHMTTFQRQTNMLRLPNWLHAGGARVRRLLPSMHVRGSCPALQAVGEHNFASWSLKGEVNMFQKVQNNLLVLDAFIADLKAMR